MPTPPKKKCSAKLISHLMCLGALCVLSAHIQERATSGLRLLIVFRKSLQWNMVLLLVIRKGHHKKYTVYSVTGHLESWPSCVQLAASCPHVCRLYVFEMPAN